MGMYLDIPFDGTCKTCMFCKPFDNGRVYCERHPEMIIEDGNIRQLFCPVKAIDLVNIDSEFRTTEFIVDNGKVELDHKIIENDTGKEYIGFIYNHKRGLENCFFDSNSKRFLGYTTQNGELIIGNIYLLSILEFIKSNGIDINPAIQLVRYNKDIKQSAGIRATCKIYRDNIMIREDWGCGFSDNHFCFIDKKDNWFKSYDFTLPMYKNHYKLIKLGE